jgi:hypothetical protein
MMRDEFMEGTWSRGRAYHPFLRVGLMVKLFLTSLCQISIVLSCLQLAASVVAAAVATL